MMPHNLYARIAIKQAFQQMEKKNTTSHFNDKYHKICSRNKIYTATKIMNWPRKESRNGITNETPRSNSPSSISMGRASEKEEKFNI